MAKFDQITGVQIDADGKETYTYGYDTYILKPVGLAPDGETVLVEIIPEGEESK